MTPRYWSDHAHSEFAALFEDRLYSDRFKDALADALIRGWPPNRDKPVWALAVLVAALGKTGGAERAGGLLLLALSPDEVFARLAAHPASDPATVTIEPLGRVVRLGAFEAIITLGRTRIALLRKLAEFLLAADDYRHTADVTAILDALAAPGGVDETAFREGVRALARRLYDYRKIHFAEGHAASGFDFIKRTLGGSPRRETSDDEIFALWRDPQNRYFVMYRTALLTALDFLAMRRALAERGAFETAGSVEDPLLARTLGGREEDDGGLDFAALEPDDTPLAALRETDLKTYAQAELDVLELVAATLPEGERRPRALLRLLAFHPIQSGLSNSLRTGRSKVPLEERVTCVEAADYHKIDQRLAAMGERTAGWLAVLLSLSSANDDARTAAVRDKGRAILTRSRSQSFAHPPEVLRARFEAIRAALLALAGMIATARTQIAAHGRVHPLCEAFEADKAAFAAEFTRRYRPARGGADGG
ncbi:hypothetical protein L1787_03085 [Acuticoccus sp. M5D2P5]|uniref:hypothetical protein n=1 Tax=Acuticoccus kalidii TaxID=2910977 RepID=UPI001F3EB3FB|nr:hypothetical protein [Acuticoccus kalidii]MCF3932399.1 hypothetical protein [Acuticoccus kalidii]